MATPVDVASAFETLPQRKERLHKAFADIESKKASFSKVVANWKDVDDHFKEIENSLRKTLEEYYAKEKAFEAKMKEAQAALDKRDAEVSAKERASLVRVQDQKDAAIAAILDHKRKRADGQKGGGVSGAVGTSGAKKGQPAKRENGSVAQPMDVDVKAAAGASGNSALDSALSGLLVKEISEKDNATASKEEVTAPPPLKSTGESLDSEGLRLVIAKHRKDFTSLSADLPSALKRADDPADLVLQALEGYCPFSQGSKEDSTHLANRRQYVILLEALSEVLADPILGAEHPVVPVKHKKSAKKLGDLWKSKMNLEGATKFNVSLDAQCFLQLLATFGLSSDYDPDLLCRLLAAIARRKQTPALCRSLGLSAKASDVVDILMKECKHIDALAFAKAFDLLGRFQPVPVLKSYLKEIKKLAQATLKSGRNSTAAQNEASQKEMSALKAVLKTIGEYKLEGQYPPSSIESRIAQLEKAKADKKRPVTSPSAQQPKKPRTTNDVPSGSGGKVGPIGSGGKVGPAAVSEKKPFIHGSDRVEYGGVGGSSYGAIPPKPAFNRRSLGGYNSAYGGGNLSPVTLSGSHLYPSDGLGSLGYGSSAFLNSSSSYGGYDYGPSLAAAPSGYRSYLH